MRRLILGSVVSGSLLLLAACSGDPTDVLRGGVAKLNPSPSKLFVEQGKTTAVDVTATDDQGNQFVTPFTLSDVGSGITVQRDLTFRPVFVNDSQTGPPTADAIFRYRVTANDLVGTSFTVEAGGKSVVVPVAVVPAPGTIPAAAVTQSGPTAQDTITLTMPAPYAFQGTAAAFLDIGNAVILGRSPDGTSLKLFALPGTASLDSITGLNLPYMPAVPLVTTPASPVTVNTTVVAATGTDDPATAPPITIPAAGEQSGFIDAGTMAAASCGGNSGAPCQLYSFSLSAETNLHVKLLGSNAADLGLYFINADDGSDSDQFCDGLGRDEVPEECDLTFPAGNYLMSVVSFGPFYAENDPNPDWVAVYLSQ